MRLVAKCLYKNLCGGLLPQLEDTLEERLEDSLVLTIILRVIRFFSELLFGDLHPSSSSLSRSIGTSILVIFFEEDFFMDLDLVFLEIDGVSVESEVLLAEVSVFVAVHGSTVGSRFLDGLFLEESRLQTLGESRRDSLQTSLHVDDRRIQLGVSEGLFVVRAFVD